METSGAGLEATSGKLSVPDVPHEAAGRPGMVIQRSRVNDNERMVAVILNMSNIFLHSAKPSENTGEKELRGHGSLWNGGRIDHFVLLIIANLTGSADVSSAMSGANKLVRDLVAFADEDVRALSICPFTWRMG